MLLGKCLQVLEVQAFDLGTVRSALLVSCQELLLAQEYLNKEVTISDLRSWDYLHCDILRCWEMNLPTIGQEVPQFLLGLELLVQLRPVNLRCRLEGGLLVLRLHRRTHRCVYRCWDFERALLLGLNRV